MEQWRPDVAAARVAAAGRGDDGGRAAATSRPWGRRRLGSRSAAGQQQPAGRGDGGGRGSKPERRRTATGQQAVGTAAAGQQVGRSNGDGVATGGEKESTCALISCYGMNSSIPKGAKANHIHQG